MLDAIYTTFETDEETLILLVVYSILVVMVVCYLVKFRGNIKERFSFEQRRSKSTFAQADVETMPTTWKDQKESEVYAEEVLGLR